MRNLRSQGLSDLIPPPETELVPRVGYRRQCSVQTIYFHGFFTVEYVRIHKIDDNNLCRPSNQVYMLMELELQCSDGTPVRDHAYKQDLCVLYDGNKFYYINEEERHSSPKQSRGRQRFCVMTCRLSHPDPNVLYSNEAKNLRQAANQFIDNPDQVIRHLVPDRVPDHVELRLAR